MAEKTVFSDASPLIGLAAAGGFELLRRLFCARIYSGCLLRDRFYSDAKSGCL
jgi:hypothetical protein